MAQTRRRVLVLDDNEMFRFVLCNVFEARGYEVLAFAQPRVCPLSSAQACPCPKFNTCVDLIVSDLNMLGINGLDFVQELLAKGCRVRNIALISGTFSEEDLARASQLSCAAFSKPLNMAAFLSWVDGVERSIQSEPHLFDWT